MNGKRISNQILATNLPEKKKMYEDYEYPETYKIVSGSRESVVEEVNRLMRKGWRVCGGIATDNNSFYQAMTKG